MFTELSTASVDKELNPNVDAALRHLPRLASQLIPGLLPFAGTKAFVFVPD